MWPKIVTTQIFQNLYHLISTLAKIPGKIPNVTTAAVLRGQKLLYDYRDKRGALHLAGIIRCATNCDPLSFKGYGCYCGFLGSGTPMDGIDT